MRVLALEPYHGGSHKAFLDGWSQHSNHDWTILGLPAYKWKWRMRHAAITLADQVRQRVSTGAEWDVLFCSDMLNLAEFLGLAPKSVRDLPSIAYFHENQLTYPVRAQQQDRDYHFAFSNMTTALAATQVWFNSAFHRDTFLDALATFLRRMPDYQPLHVIERIRDKSHVQPQGVSGFPSRKPRKAGPLRILWAARWEHDKDPETFFRALEILRSDNVDFRLSVIGEQFSGVPPVFETARRRFANNIDHWGYQQTRSDYEAALTQADVVVSTAQHEFFGISIVEAIAAGAYPLLPKRLAYPEVLQGDDQTDTTEFFYDGSDKELASRLAMLADRENRGDLWQGDPHRCKRIVSRFDWFRLAPQLDTAAIKAATEREQ